jgi:hypothetical protein
MNVMNSRRRMSCPQTEARNLAHYWTMKGAVHRSEIFPLMSVQGEKRRIHAPDEFGACPLLFRKLTKLTAMTSAA